MTKFLHYVLQVLIAFDQFINALCGGWADETLSSVAHRMREKDQPIWGWTARFINVLFFWQKDHCQEAYESEVERWQVPPELRSKP